MFDDVFVLAEAGVNHNGDLKLALELVDAAVAAGADGIKFQTFKTETLIQKDTAKAPYQEAGDDSSDQFSMLKSLELSFDEFREIQAYCNSRGVLFLSTAFDDESFDFLRELSLPFWKVPSGEITNLPYLLRVAETRDPVVLSTGMSRLDEVALAVATLREHGSEDLTLLHCTTAYPCPPEDVNLLAMRTLADTFDLPVGYSDHTVDEAAAIAAVALGACFIEKHLTLSHDLPGPDHRASLEPQAMQDFVAAIRRTSRLLGDGTKAPTELERANLIPARKSLHARVAIKKGELFTPERLIAMRPGDGLSPTEYFKLLNQPASRDYAPLEALDPSELERATRDASHNEER